MESKMSGWQHPHLSDRGGSPNRSECVASRPCRGAGVRRHTQFVARVSLPESDFVRIHETGRASAKHNIFSTRRLLPAGARLVREIDGFSLEHALETRNADNDPGQPWNWKGLDTARADAGYVDLGRVDGLSARRRDFADVHGSFWP